MRKLIATCVLLTVIVVVQTQAVSLLNRLTPRAEINAYDYGLNPAQSLTAAELEKLQDYAIAYRKAFPTAANGINVTAVATNSRYDRYREFDLLRGAFFTETASQIGFNAVVISDTLSFDLFQSVNTVGDRLNINGLPYQIVGVYTRRPLFTFLMSDGTETIYIPVGSDADRLYGGAIQSAAASPPDMSAELAETEIMNSLRRVSGNAFNYRVHDYTAAPRVVFQFIQIEIFLTVLMLYALAARYFIQDIKKQRSSDVTALLTFALKWIIVLFICLLIYRFIAFDLYVDARYVSSERLLDFEFYKEMIQKAAQTRNLHYAYVPPLYERLYNAAWTINAALCAIYVLLLGKLVRHFTSSKLYRPSSSC